MTWADDAECVGIPVDEFFVGPGELYPVRVLDACARCPVWEPCLLDALTDTDTINHGYRGGTVPRTRQRMMRDPWFLRDFIAARRNRSLINA